MAVATALSEARTSIIGATSFAELTMPTAEGFSYRPIIHSRWRTEPGDGYSAGCHGRDTRAETWYGLSYAAVSYDWQCTERAPRYIYAFAYEKICNGDEALECYQQWSLGATTGRVFYMRLVARRGERAYLSRFGGDIYYRCTGIWPLTTEFFGVSFP